VWVLGLVLLTLAAVAVAAALVARRRVPPRPVVSTHPHPDSGTRRAARPWEREAESLRATKPSQAQATESPAQQQAPRASDS
jgi:hypothetical protein